MAQQTHPFSNKMIWRILFIPFHLIIILVLMLLFYKNIFELKIDSSDWEIYYRLIWCFVCGLFGFTVLNFKLIIRDRIEKRDEIIPYLRYSIYYPVMIAFISLIPFFIFNIWSSKLFTLFYAGSGFLSFFLSFYDKFYDIFLKFIEKIRK